MGKFFEQRTSLFFQLTCVLNDKVDFSFLLAPLGILNTY